MCVAYPGKVLTINGDHANVDFAGSRTKVNISMVDAKVGDYVLVHAGMALQKMKQEEAESLTDLFSEVHEAANGS